MLTDKLISTEWYPVDDWSEMRSSAEYSDYNEYTEGDFDNFVEIKFRKIAEELGVRYRDVKDVLYGRNIKFFELKARIFENSDCIDSDSDEYDELTSMLLEPSILCLRSVNNVDRFVGYFNELNIQDKVAILTRLSKATLDVSSDQSGSEGTNACIRTFEQLSQDEKCEVVRRVFGIKITII